MRGTKSLHSCWMENYWKANLRNTSQANTRQRVVLVRIRMFTKPRLWTNRVSAYLPAVGSSFRGQGVRWQQLSHPHSVLTAVQWWVTIGGLEPPSLFLMAHWAPRGLFCPSILYTFLCVFSLSSANYLCEHTM